MPDQNKLTLSEQEIGDLHIFRRSIYPLVIRLILINLIALVAGVFLNLFVSSIKDNLTVGSFVAVETLLLLFIQLGFGFSSLFVTLNWLSTIFIVKFPEVTIRSGILIIEEKNYIANSVKAIRVEQDVFGKIFDYGTVILEKAIDQEVDLFFPEIADPKHLVDLAKKKPDEE